MSSEQLMQVVGRALMDPEFREQLLNDPDAALAGFDLTQEEIESLSHLSSEKLSALSDELSETGGGPERAIKLSGRGGPEKAIKYYKGGGKPEVGGTGEMPKDRPIYRSPIFIGGVLTVLVLGMVAVVAGVIAVVSLISDDDEATSVQVGLAEPGVPAENEKLQQEEPFAPPQFEELEDNEELSPPDFGEQEAGCKVGPDGEGCEEVVVADVGSPDGGVSGRIIRLSVTNTGSDEVVTTIPCGLVFQPGNIDEQRMMVIQPVSVSLAAGATQDLTPYVMCIDSDKDAASIGASYSVGTFAREDLLALAGCVCERDLAAELDPTVGDFGLQLAVWSVADGRPLEEVETELAAEREMVAEFLPEGVDLDNLEGFEDLEGFEGLGGLEGLEGMEELFATVLGALTVDIEDVSLWFDECGVYPGNVVS